MRLLHAWIGNDGKPVKTAKGPRYQVRWRLDRGAGQTPLEKKLTTFRTVAAAKAFIERLEKAEYGVVDKGAAVPWRFDGDGHPTDLPPFQSSVFSALELYVSSRWSAVWRTNTRTRNRMRLVELVALTCASSRDAQALLVALDEQRPDRRRPEPTTLLEWAARYLRDCGLRPAGELSAELAEGRRWVETHSIPLSALTIERVKVLRNHYCRTGLADGTARTYWSGTAIPFLTWLIDTDQIPRSVVKGQAPLDRDMEAERPDPRRIPDPVQIERIAARFEVRHGSPWGTFVRLTTRCALRLSEALDVRGTNFVEQRGRLYLRVATQQLRVTRADSDDGATLARTGTKSTRNRTPKVREVPLPAELESEVRALLGPRLGRDASPIFVGRRGALAPAEAVRRWWREAVDEVLVPDAPALLGITPHSMRHAGMTYWFAQGVDHKRIQLWGGWSSLRVMLDIYRGVLESLEEVDLAKVDLFDSQMSNREAAVNVVQDASVIDLARWKDRTSQHQKSQKEEEQQ